MYTIEVSPTLMDRIKEAQEKDLECANMLKRILDGEELKYKLNNVGIICFEGRVWIPKKRRNKGESVA